MPYPAKSAALSHDKRMDVVIDALKRQIDADRLSPEGAYFDARFLLFQLLIGMGRDEEAVEMWRECPGLRPEVAMPGAEGLLALYLSGPDQAIEVLYPWTDSDRELPVDVRRDVWQSLCLAYESKGDFQSALHAARETFRYAQERSNQNAKSLATLLSLELQLAREHALAQRALIHAGKLAAVGQLASSVAHEISQPAGALMLLCVEGQEHAHAERWPEVSECLFDMERQIMRLRRLIMRIKDFSRDEPVDIRCLSLAEVVDEAQRLISPAVRAAGITLQVDVPELMVLADQESVVLSLVNLVNNGLDALREQQVPPPFLRIEGLAHPEAREVKLMVIDNGPGLSERVLASIFQPFFTTKSSGHGLGLGLTITRQALMRIGASMDVQNEPGRGARFTVHLPAAER
jgi:C4-dicarboxylate-specific signal transduction histidine kinase